VTFLQRICLVKTQYISGALGSILNNKQLRRNSKEVRTSVYDVLNGNFCAQSLILRLGVTSRVSLHSEKSSFLGHYDQSSIINCREGITRVPVCPLLI
jgi:hypothetical protein